MFHHKHLTAEIPLSVDVKLVEDEHAHKHHHFHTIAQIVSHLHIEKLVAVVEVIEGDVQYELCDVVRGSWFPCTKAAYELRLSRGLPVRKVYVIEEHHR